LRLSARRESGFALAECGYNEVALGRVITVTLCPARAASEMTAISIGQWIVEASLNRLSCDSRVIQLEPKVMQVLVCLAGRPGEVIAKEELFSTVWPETFVSEDVLTRSISQLRKVFDDDAREPRYIETISRRGYRLVAPVSASSHL
jgi:adenylate cyclase